MFNRPPRTGPTLREDLELGPRNLILHEDHEMYVYFASSSSRLFIFIAAWRLTRVTLAVYLSYRGQFR